MAATLPPVDGRPVLRCDRCRLVQFPTAAEICRRCRAPYWPPPPRLEVKLAPGRRSGKLRPRLTTADARAAIDLGFAVRLLRQARGLSQYDLVEQAGFVRSYISRLENRRALPSLAQLPRLAAALGVTVYVLMVLATVHLGLKGGQQKCFT